MGIPVTVRVEQQGENAAIASSLVVRLMHQLTRWSVYGLFFLVPLLFLPLTVDPFETNKQILLVILSALALVGWLAHMVIDQHIRIRTGLLNVIPALYLVAVVISGVFSLTGYQTWFGGMSQEYTSVLTAGTLVVLFYVLANVTRRMVSERGVLCAMLLASAISGLVTLLGMLNILHLPFSFAQSTAFTTMGPIHLFAIYQIAVMFAGLTAWVTWPVSGDGEALLGGRMGTVLRTLVVIVSVATLFQLVALDHWVLWALSVLGVLLILSVGFLKGEEMPRPSRFLLPFAVLILSVVFLFLPSPLKIQFPIVVSPNYSSSFDIAKQTLSQGPVRLLVGSGPGTFMNDFLRYKSPALNGTIFWSIPFDRGQSHLLTLLATVGVVGTSLLVLFGMLLGIHALGRLAFERQLGDWKGMYVFFVPWAVLAVGQALYSTNLSLQFLFWALSGVLASYVLARVRDADFAEAPRLALLVSFGCVLLAVGTLGAVVVSGQREASEIAFAKAVSADRSGQSIDDLIAQLNKAANMSPMLKYDVYHRNLAAALLAKASMQLQAAGAQPTQQDVQAISQSVSAAVAQATTATQLGQNTVANWVVLGSIYRDVMPFANGAEDYAAAVFQKAAELEPSNPSHQTNLGRVHLAVADRARQLKSAEDADLAKQASDAEVSELKAAEDAFNAAIALKGDYAPAHYYIAAVYERQGRLEEAAVRLQALTRYAPADVGLGFQFAMMAIRLKNLEVARSELERVIGLSPEYSNALWYLSAVYEELGNDEMALQKAKQVLLLNPANEAAKKRVEALESGTSTPSIPAPVEEGDAEVIEVPVEETP